MKRKELYKINLENKDSVLKNVRPLYRMIYEEILTSRGYTFNKAHAVAYGFLTYYIAYLKANFFPHFFVRFLNSKKEKTSSFIQEAFFCDFVIIKPDINHSHIKWERKGRKLIMGFDNLKNYQNDFFLNIIVEREKNGLYQNWEDFLIRTLNLWQKVTIKDFLSWIQSKLFNIFDVDATTLREKAHDIFRYIEIRRQIPYAKKLDLPFLHLEKGIKKLEKKYVNEQEWENWGYYISFFSRWKELKKNKNISSFLDIAKEASDGEILADIYIIITRKKEKNEDVWLLFLQDLCSSFKIEISKEIHQKNYENLTTHNELLLTCSFKGLGNKMVVSLKNVNKID